MLVHGALTRFLQIQRYQNVINQGGHPISLVSMVTTLCETRLYRRSLAWRSMGRIQVHLICDDTKEKQNLFKTFLLIFE